MGEEGRVSPEHGVYVNTKGSHFLPGTPKLQAHGQHGKEALVLKRLTVMQYITNISLHLVSLHKLVLY